MNYLGVTIKLFSFWCTITTLLFASFLSGCVTTKPSLQEQLNNFKHEKLLETTSKQDFLAIEPTLNKIKAGISIEDTGLKWPAYELNDNTGKLCGLVAYSKGWLEPLSGGLLGAIYKFGNPIGRLGNKVYGNHVYGYTWLNNNLIPQYILTTEATVITQQEYESLLEIENNNIGFFNSPNESESKTYFKNILVREVQKINFETPPSSSLTLDIEPVNSQNYADNYLSKDAFNQAKEILGKIKPGTNMWEAINLLGGKIVKYQWDNNFTIMGMNGFLNFKGEYRMQHTANNGHFIVSPFGYVEAGTEIPQIALISKNGEVYKITPYTSPDQLKILFQ